MKILTPKQYEVLVSASHGKSCAQTAEEMHISIYTVKEYRGLILQKLGARNVSEATSIAIQAGLLP